MAFVQSPPQLGNQFDEDSLLVEHLERQLPPDLFAGARDEYRELGQLGGGELYRAYLEDRENEPVLTQWDPWGNRIDHIEVSPLWKRAEKIAAERGLVAAAYEDAHGPHARTHQFALNYLVQASLDVYSCPLAMTDGAARTLLDSGNQALIDRALPHLTSRNPKTMWTSGQWMTERTGGSDVGLSETVARGEGDGWRLYGTKWFTSATTSQMALTLGRPEGNGPGGRGLALFYVELRDDDGRLQNIQVNRLKDKLGTRKVPTAELTLDGTPATPVGELGNGVRSITPMLNITRTWNAMASAWAMRRAVALAMDYAGRRRAFGDVLSKKPLHLDTLSSMIAEQEAATLMAFRVAELLGKIERKVATDHERLLFRILTPIAKLLTAKQAVAVTSEAIESFGGAGYVEDTGLPRMLADAQVLPIWEGTTNVLSLDTLRAMSSEGTFEALSQDLHQNLEAAATAELGPSAQAARSALEHATAWLSRAMNEPATMERGARRLALTLGRAYQLSLLAGHAQWAMDEKGSKRGITAANRFASHGVDAIRDELDNEEAAPLFKL